MKHEHLLASSSIPYVYAPIGIEDNQHWDGAVMYNSPLRPAIDAEADEILMVLLSPYHKLEENDPRPMVQRSALPPMPRGLIGGVGYVLDLALIGTFENDFEELRKVNRRVRQGQGQHARRSPRSALRRHRARRLDLAARHHPLRAETRRELRAHGTPGRAADFPAHRSAGLGFVIQH